MRWQFQIRILLFAALMLFGTWTLLARLYEFQIKEQAYYVAQKPKPRLVKVREPGVRGEIKDRSGIPLAVNQRNYELAINLGELREAWLDSEDKVEFPQVDDRDVSEILEVFLLPRLEALGIRPRLRPSAIRTHYITHGSLVPYSLQSELSFEEFSLLAERGLDLPGVYVKTAPLRRYPYGALACHVLGYVQQWKKGEYAKRSDQDYDHYFGESSGVAGLERGMNSYLVGSPGVRTYEKDERNQIIGSAIEVDPPGQGCEVTLTIDSGIQHLVENILRRAGRAAAVVMDVQTGEILAMASLPSYDPNHFVPSISQSQFREYNTNAARSFQNRAVTRFEPGSTTKLAVSLVGLLSGKSGFEHHCWGSLTYGKNKRPIRCHRTEGHGLLNLEEAIQRSCNPYFMDLAGELGRETVIEGFQALHLGKRFDIRLPEEQSGTLPGSQAWANQRGGQRSITEAQLAMISIGQWQMQATPLQITAITSCIANGGRFFKPRLVKRASNARGVEVITDEPELLLDFQKEGVEARAFERVRRGMWMAANEAGGTATNISLKNYRIAAKTGTVQVPPRGNNSWVTTFAPYQSPRYAVTVFVEGGASGGKVAGPLAHMILRGLAAVEAGFKLPTKSMGVFAGHLERIEAIDFPRDGLITIPLEESGETGEEANDVRDEVGPVRVEPTIIPLPGGSDSTSSRN